MKVVLINGAPRAGKDTFVEYVSLAAPRACLVHNVSTVDYVKAVARYCGWDGTKDNKSRKFLSELKRILTEWNDVPVSKVEEDIRAWAADLKNNNISLNNAVCFIHVREPAELGRLKVELNAITLCIRRTSAEETITSNSSDADVLNYNYDCVIENNGSMTDLMHQAKMFYEYITTI